MGSYVNKNTIATYFQGRCIARSSRGLHLLLTCQPSSLETLNSVIKHTFTHWGRIKSMAHVLLILGQNLDGNHMTDKIAIDFGEAS